MNLNNKRGQVLRTKDALPFLETGAIFVYEPQISFRGKIRSFKMRLLFPDGDYITGSWGNAKNELWRMCRLEALTFRGKQAWKLKQLGSKST